MEFKIAQLDDLPDIVNLLVDDELGMNREKYEEPLPEEYVEAFKDIEEQTGNQMIVAVIDHNVVGCLQLTFIPTVARLGMKRAQIEGVRVSRDYRSRGVGKALFETAIQMSRDNNCELVQLTTDKSRQDAHHFYKRSGFAVTHDGMKMFL